MNCWMTDSPVARRCPDRPAALAWREQPPRPRGRRRRRGEDRVNRFFDAPIGSSVDERNGVRAAGAGAGTLVEAAR